MSNRASPTPALDDTAPRVAYYPPIKPGAQVLIEFQVQDTDRGGDLIQIRLGGRTHWLSIDRVEGLRP